MKKVLLLACALTLTSCAPLARLVEPATQLAQPNERATLTREGLTLTVTNPGPDALTGDRSLKEDGPVLEVFGVNIKPGEKARTWCQADLEVDKALGAWTCNLPEIPAGGSTSVAFEQDAPEPQAEITLVGFWGYRPSLGARPVILWLK